MSKKNEICLHIFTFWRNIWCFVLRHAPSPSFPLFHFRCGFPPKVRSHCAEYMQIFSGFFCCPHHCALLTIIESLRSSVYQYVPFSEACFGEGVRQNSFRRGRITPEGEHTLSMEKCLDLAFRTGRAAGSVAFVRCARCQTRVRFV